MSRTICLSIMLLASALAAAAAPADRLRPGQVWLDDAGQPIQAHGGGILVHDGVYYWYGENKAGPTLNNHRVDVIGVSCYSSRDLYNWHYEGLALRAEPDDPASDLHPSQVVERPKVVYNDATGQFVMWVHIDSPDYQKGHVGRAVADSPAGPFRYLGSMTPNGAQSRDMTVFKDDDGAAYLIFGAGWHDRIQIARLNDDYTSPTGQFVEIYHSAGPPNGREAPALFKHGGKYYLITSGTTGWSQNPGAYAIGDSMFGPWREMGNPFTGPDADTSHHSQSTFVLPVPGRPGAFIYLGDRWNPQNLGDSRYIWLPIEFDGEAITIPWLDEWDLSWFDR